jgi:GAF domain-containing protein
MEFDAAYEPDYDSLKTLLLEMAQEHAVGPLLEMIVRQLARQPHVALARIWLIQEGDCPCPAKEKTCDETARCLHLVASEGRPLADKHADWSRLDGEFSRFPLGARKIGWIAATGRAVEVNDIEQEPKWIARPKWARQEGIIGLGGQPLLYKGEVLGVLAVSSVNGSNMKS